MLNIGKDVDLRKLAKEAYALSAPRGLGFLHATDGPLDDETIDSLLTVHNHRTPLYMDYVHGRCCKLNVRRDEDGMHYVSDQWYDHGSWDELFRRCGIVAETRPETAAA